MVCKQKINRKAMVATASGADAETLKALLKDGSDRKKAIDN